MTDTTKAFVAMGAGALILLIIVFGPLLTIWSLNTLFGLGIGYTFKTWLASLLLGGLIHKTQIKAKS